MYHKQPQYSSAKVSPRKTNLELEKTKAKEYLKENYKLNPKNTRSRRPSCKIIKEYKMKET